ncbi:MAG: 2'-5' RNA ligase family protein [Bacteroidia bacterium]
MPLQKYFIALVPPEPLYGEISDLKKEVAIAYNNKSALKSPPHITLHMPFEWKTEKEAVLIEQLKLFQFTGPIAIGLNGFGCFEPKVVFIDVVKNEQLGQLQKELVQHVKSNLGILNQANDLRGFHPHVTIAFRDLKKADFYRMMEEYKEKPFVASFSCCDFCLLKHNGKSWDVLERFLLQFDR